MIFSPKITLVNSDSTYNESNLYLYTLFLLTEFAMNNTDGILMFVFTSCPGIVQDSFDVLQYFIIYTRNFTYVSRC